MLRVSALTPLPHQHNPRSSVTITALWQSLLSEFPFTFFQSQQTWFVFDLNLQSKNVFVNIYFMLILERLFVVFIFQIFSSKNMKNKVKTWLLSDTWIKQKCQHWPHFFHLLISSSSPWWSWLWVYLQVLLGSIILLSSGRVPVTSSSQTQSSTRHRWG